METCASHTKLCEDVVIIKQKILTLSDGISEHIKSGASWRGFMVGLGITIILNIITFTYLFGQLNKQVEINTDKWAKLEDILYSNFQSNIGK